MSRGHAEARQAEAAETRSARANDRPDAAVAGDAARLLALQQLAGNRATASALAGAVQRRPHHGAHARRRRRSRHPLTRTFHVRHVVPAEAAASATARAAQRPPLDTERPPELPEPSDLWQRLPPGLRPRSHGSLGLDAQVAVNQNLGVLGPGPLRGPDLQQGDTTVGVNVLAISREFALAQVNGSSERPWDVVFEPNTLFSIAYVPHGVDPAHVQATLGVAADILHRKVNRWLDAHVVQAQLFGGVDVPLGGGPSLPIVGGQLGSSAEVALPDDEGREPSERVTLTVGGAAQIQSVGGVPSAALLLNVTLTVHVLRDHGEP